MLYTAHYDHLGIRPDMPGDNIYNGARRQRHRLRHPAGDGARLRRRRRSRARSIFFAAVTAEEQGLLGSEYLGKHPPVPAGRSRSI